MFLVLSKVPEMFPSFNVKKAMFSCINSTGHRVVGCK
jgi:hypothetical protein